MEDKNSGELFAACPIENYPGTSVEAVTDSSRYFVVCIQDSGRKAYIGIGFTDRSDSFDLNVTLQDHFKQLKKEDLFSKQATDPQPNLDLAFKEGQTIRINIPSKTANANPGAANITGGRPKANKSMGGILPPPPGGGGNAVPRIPPSVSSGSLSSSGPVISGTSGGAVADLLGDFATPPAAAPAAEPSKAFSDFDEWGDFASSKGPPSTQTVSSGNWEQF